MNFIIQNIVVFNSVAVVCPRLSEPINGHMNCSSEEPTFGTVCTFGCLDGHQLIRNEIMTCNLNGSWSGEVPLCQGKLLTMTVWADTVYHFSDEVRWPF